MNHKVYGFSKKYEAVCRPSTEYRRRAQTVPVKFGMDPADVLYQELPYQSVPMVEIHLPEDRFRALIEHDAFLDKFKYLKNSTFYDQMIQAKAIVDQHEMDCHIRNRHPTVQAAYEQYLTLLNLCR